MAVLTTRQKRDINNGAIAYTHKIGDRMGYLDSDGTYVGTLAGGRVPFVADTGGLSANQFGAVSGYDSTTGYMKLVKADSDTATLSRDLWFVPTAVTAAATGYAYKMGVIADVNTNAGEVGDPVYLSGTAGGWTLSKPTTGNQVEIGTIMVKSATVGKVNVDLEGDKVIVHDHSDNANGGTLSTPALSGSTETVFTVNSGGAAAKLAIDTNSATGAFTQTVSPANLTISQRVTLPDAPSGAASVAYTSGKQSLTLSGSTSGGIVLSPTAVGTSNVTIANQACAAPTAITLPTEAADGKYFAVTTNADGSVSTTDATGTTAASFTVDSDVATGNIKIQPTAGATNHTMTLTNAAMTTDDRTITFPNASSTVALIGLAQTFTAAQTFSATATFTGAITQTGAVTFGTGTGAVSLNGDTTVAAGADLIGAAGDGALNFGSMTGTMSTPTGTNTLSGNVVISGTKTFTTGTGAITVKGATTFDAGLDIAYAGAGDGIINFGNQTGAFTTSSGTNTLSGHTVVADGKTFKVGSATGGVANAVQLYSATAANGSFILHQPDNAGNFAATLQPVATLGQATAFTIPDPGGATGTVMLLEGAQTVAGVQTFTAAPVITKDDTTDGVVAVLTVTHSSSDNNATAGDGAKVSIQLENATGTSTVEEWASLQALSTTITNGSEDGDVIISTMLGGAVQPALSIDASDQSVVVGQNVTDADGVNQIRVFPRTTAKGSLLLTATDNTGDSEVQITNEAFGQATVITIPDPGAATCNLAYGDGDGKTAVANLAAATQDLIPTATITAGAEAAHARTITVQVKDAAGNALTEFFRIRMWVAAAGDYAVPGATGTDTFGAPSAGAIFETITAKADYEILTDTDGKYVFELTHNDAGSNRYVMVDIGGRVYSSGALVFDAV